MKPVAPFPKTIRVSVRDGGLIIEALAELPFKMVFDLIGKLNQQANRQSGADDDRDCEFSLANDELVLIVKALGDLPFNRVHVLLSSLQAQITPARRPASAKD